MDTNALTAISPIDGRYRDKTEVLSAYFSEFALIKYRVLVEIEYFLALYHLPLPQLETLNANDSDIVAKLRYIYEDFSINDAELIKNTEKVINHDVKSVEYFVKQKFSELGLENYAEFVHFGLTSQDINNTAIPLSLKHAVVQQYLPVLDALVAALAALGQGWAHIPMLAFTHGQPATPTLLGKEISVFVERLNNQIAMLKSVPFGAKFGGASGNLNAHKLAFPHVDWVAFSNSFVSEKLGLLRYQHTTQIEHYDFMAALFDNLKRINTILIDLCRDIWTYISMDYFTQELKAGEVGSSAMPHKINPIDFENAEGNFGFANAIFEYFSGKLPISRLQRDLTDSTTLRNIGVPLGHTLIGLQSLSKGLSKIKVNEAKINQDLGNNWAVVAEAIQTILRRENYPKPYEALKDLTRTGSKITQETLSAFIENLHVSAEIKQELLAITPFNYTGA